MTMVFLRNMHSDAWILFYGIAFAGKLVYRRACRIFAENPVTSVNGRRKGERLYFDKRSTKKSTVSSYFLAAHNGLFTQFICKAHLFFNSFIS